MLNKLALIMVFLFPVLLFGQERQQLRGKAIADVTTAEGVTVKNRTTAASVITVEEGSFEIAAQEGDVLEFTSEVFKTLTHTLTAKDFEEEFFVIRLEPTSYMLEEVEVSGLTGSLAIDSKNTKVELLNEKFKKDFDAKVINSDLALLKTTGNMNFVAIAGMAGRALFPSKSGGEYVPKAPIEHKLFSKVLQESYPVSFFTDTIKVPKEKLGLFLDFCNEGAKRYLLDPKNEAELIEYLKERYSRYVYQSTPPTNED